MFLWSLQMIEDHTKMILLFQSLATTIYDNSYIFSKNLYLYIYIYLHASCRYMFYQATANSAALAGAAGAATGAEVDAVDGVSASWPWRSISFTEELTWEIGSLVCLLWEHLVWSHLMTPMLIAIFTIFRAQLSLISHVSMSKFNPSHTERHLHFCHWHHQMTWYDSGCFCRQDERKHLQCFSQTRWTPFKQLQLDGTTSWSRFTEPHLNFGCIKKIFPKKSSKAFPLLVSFSHVVLHSTTKSAWNCPLHTERPLGVVKINCESEEQKETGPFLFAQLRSEKSLRKRRLLVTEILRATELGSSAFQTVTIAQHQFHFVMYQGYRI